MFPTLFQLGPLAITSLGFFLFLALLTAAFLVWQKGKEENFEPELLMDCFLLTVMVSFLGGRLVYLLTAGGSLFWFFSFFTQPGFSYFGFFLTGLIFIIYFSHLHSWKIFNLLEILVFGLIPAQILVRIGNFLDGSFYGKSTSLPWGIKFPGLETAVHPLSIYEIIFLLGLYFLIKNWERQYRLFDWYKTKRGEAQVGFLFLVYVIGYGAFRFLLEFLKPSLLYWKGLSWEQWAAIIMVIGGAISLYERTGRSWFNIKFKISRFLKDLRERYLKKSQEKNLKVIADFFLKRKPKIKEKETSFHPKVGMEANKR